jgi:hypothetical protein
MGPQVHVGAVEPHEERGIRAALGFDERQRGVAELLIDGLHALPRQGTDVLDTAVGAAVKHSSRHPSGGAR